MTVFDDSPGQFKKVLDKVESCTMRENVLPKIGQQEGGENKNKTTEGVVVTSLSSSYFEQVRDLYWENPTAMGEVVGAFQPSNEGHQQSQKENHNQKAWAEMYLLSLTDKLVTSGWSTFGYVAQGLGGVKPWILYKSENQMEPDPPCQRAVSIEPCFHSPPNLDCRARGGDTSALGPHVMHCEDRSWGIKLFNKL